VVDVAEGRSARRARIYSSLAELFRPPSAPGSEGTRVPEATSLRQELLDLGVDEVTLQLAVQLSALLEGVDPKELEEIYDATFETSGEQRCVPNETAHTPDSPQESMVRTFELADIAGFYKAFGLEVTPGTEHVDHISVELEFMHLLAVKEAVAVAECHLEHADLCREAARTFLRDHLQRWCERLSNRISETSGTVSIYAAAGELLRRFVEFDVREMERPASIG
jgi:DMSO reductase family type II enzyme chaperone